MPIRLVTVFVAVLISSLLIACSPDRGNPKPPLPQVHPDASETVDTGPAQNPDLGMIQPPDSGEMMSMMDSGLPLSMACMELSDCCDEVPGQLRSRCLEQVAANNDANCQSTLSMAQQYGFCLPPNHDAGFRGDIGPLGPKCEAYLTCCPELGQLQMRCEDTAMNGDEAECEMSLMLAMQLGRCQTPPDAGMMSIDAGTSTTSMDAGTSSTAMDAGTATSTAPNFPDGG
jgi:hypothetical protein